MEVGDIKPQHDTGDCLPLARKTGGWFFEIGNKEENDLEPPDICDVAPQSMTHEEGADAVADKKAMHPEAKDAMREVKEEEAEDNWVAWQNNCSKFAEK